MRRTPHTPPISLLIAKLALTGTIVLGSMFAIHNVNAGSNSVIGATPDVSNGMGFVLIVSLSRS